jgi:branched-chain amino acid transport system permease protein
VGNALIERLAFRPFRDRSRLAPLIGTLAISFMLYQVGLAWRYFMPNWVQGEHRSVPGLPEFPSGRLPELLPAQTLIEFGFFSITAKDVLVVVAALVLALAVRWMLTSTRFGRAIRAVAENPTMATMLGVDRDRIITLTFAVGGALAGLAAFLSAAYATRPITAYGAGSGLIAFSAALLGGVGNPLGALAAALAIGLVSAFSDYGLDPAQTTLLLQLLLVVILVLQRGAGSNSEAAAEPERDPLTAGALQVGPGVRRLLWLGLAVAVLLPFWPGMPLSTSIGIGVYVLLALGLNLLIGYAGMVDLGYAVCFGLGGYVGALLTNAFRPPGEWLPQPLDLALVLACAAGASGLFGWLNGWLTLRLRGDFLAIVTLALGTVMRGLIVMNAGPDGLTAPAPPSIIGLRLDTPLEQYGLIVVLVAVVVAGSLRLVASRFGRGLIASAEDALAAAANGVSVRAHKTLAFVFSAALAGIAGAVFVLCFRYIDPASLEFQISALVLAMVMIGGPGNAPGVLAGALVIGLIDRIGIPWLGATLADVQQVDTSAASVAFNVRNLSYGLFGLLLYLGVWWRGRSV